MKSWNAIIIGAGPAGAMAACELAAAGDVLLVDKAAFPRAKVCGCCLNGAALDQRPRWARKLNLGTWHGAGHIAAVYR
jgi:flavin-dependent dehydrogenase